MTIVHGIGLGGLMREVGETRGFSAKPPRNYSTSSVHLGG